MVFVAVFLTVLAVIFTIFYILIPPAFVRFSKIRTVSGRRVRDVLPIVPRKPVFGNNFEILAQTVDTMFYFFREKAAKYKASYLMFGFYVPIYGVITAEEAEYVLSSPVIITKGITYGIFTPFLGDGLLTSTGQKWHFRRKLLTPAFHFNILQQFVEIFKEESEKFVTRIDEINAERDEIYLNELVPRFTLNNVCETALGVKLDNTFGSDDYRKNIDIIEHFIMRRAFNPWMYVDFVYKFFGERNIFDKYLHQVHQFSSQIINKRRSEFLQSKTKQDDAVGKKKQRFAMLDTLLAAEHEGQSINHEGICEEVDTFMFEGYDTTSVSLSFTLFLLGWHQDIQQKLFQEIKVSTDDVSDLSITEVNQMKYLDCVVKESLRLYPSVPLIARETTERLIIGDLIFPPGSQIIIHIYDVHRDPKYYPDPEKFDPNRFLPENTINRHPFAYIPFSAGPRNCIGQKFALLEMKFLLINTLLKYRIESITKREDIKFEGGMVLRSKTPIKVKFIKRI